MRYVICTLVLMAATPTLCQTTAEDVAKQVLESVGKATDTEPVPKVDPTEPQATDAAAPPATAADTTPQVTFELDQNDVIPGQPISLRITVLVPTQLTKPVEFPTYDIPNVITRLSEGATSPTSKRIGGTTWAGVTRRYQFLPMIVGEFTLPLDPVTIYSKAPIGQEDQVHKITPAPVRFSASLPKGAEQMDPFFAAENVTLEQVINGNPSELAPGDSFGRSITITIKGTTPILLPQLLNAETPIGLSAYPKDPVIKEHDERGQLSGTWQEDITYVAEAGVKGILPEVTFEWFDLSSNSVKTISAESVPVHADGPAVQSHAPTDPRIYLVLLAAIAVLCATLWGALRWGRPALQNRRRKARDTYLLSESYIRDTLSAAVAAKDHGSALVALADWDVFVGSNVTAPIAMALLVVGKSRYAAPPPQGSDMAWQNVKTALDNAGIAAQSHSHNRQRKTILPDLNPKALA
ncbi:MAG: hypothetical protein ABJO27_25520 [Pseudoruegeria sp.]